MVVDVKSEIYFQVYTSIPVMLLLTLLWGHSLIAMSFLTSTFFNSVKVATSEHITPRSIFIVVDSTSPQYFVMHSSLYRLSSASSSTNVSQPSPLVSHLTIFSNIQVIITGVHAGPYNLWPAFAFYRAMFQLGKACAIGWCPSTRDFTLEDEAVIACGYMLFSSSILFLLAWYAPLSTVGEVGTRVCMI